ncbi:uncharacterized protein LOC142335859 isoform X2 [Convolutriloba macropyga]|uniref:uncharacterized protein LOC142335859 isoform X2 n=1 Tax=Convolutriloba macropyga TaxID=536237 RepID=UPI003F5245E9
MFSIMTATIVTDEHGSNQFVVAKCDESETVYVAFKGTGSWEDLATDLTIAPAHAKRTVSAGKFHAGFLKRAQMFPIMRVLSSDLFLDKHLVFCGHSLGGAIASIIYIELLIKTHRSQTQIFKSVRSITFGSPFFCDSESRNYLLKIDPDLQIFNIVAENDPVPRILSLTQSMTAFHRKIQNIGSSEAVRGLQKLLSDLNPAVLAILSAASQVLLQHAAIFRSVRSGLQLLDKSQQSQVEHTYVPIGNYFFLNENSEEFKAYNVSAAAEKVMRKLDIFDSITIESIEKHNIEQYSRKCQLNKCVNFKEHRNVGKIFDLDPHIPEAELLLETDKNNNNILILTLRGKNISAAEICPKY